MKQIATNATATANEGRESQPTCFVEEKHEDDSDSDNDIDYKQSR